jgi:hypothetical protein
MIFYIFFFAKIIHQKHFLMMNGRINLISGKKNKKKFQIINNIMKIKKINRKLQKYKINKTITSLLLFQGSLHHRSFHRSTIVLEQINQ